MAAGGMNLTVITPVGPGHEAISERCIRSVQEAKGNHGPWTSVWHKVVYDTCGLLGRSKARNIGIDESPDADWFFFIDADDMMDIHALERNDFNYPATFGEVRLQGGRMHRQIWPCGWHELAVHGAYGTISMGFFCNADVARNLRFDESMDAGEDFDFYLCLPDFIKIKEPLVTIGYDQQSAGGPRGYDKIDWTGICNDLIRKAVNRDPEKFGVGSDAVLAQAGRA